MTRSSRSPSGFTLIELLIGMVILAVIGTTLTQMLVSQVRFMDRQQAARSARTTSRSAQNVIFSDLRMVETGGGVLAATPRMVDVRVPYAFGISCGTTGGSTTVSLLPFDPMTAQASALSGHAWRAKSGTYTYVDGSSVGTGAAATCTAANIAVLNGGQVITVPALPPAALEGTPVLLFQRVRYSFRASAAVPGTVGLWRTQVTAGLDEELSAPFDTSASFRFFVGSNPVSQAAAPVPLSAIRGIELRLFGMSEKAPAGTTSRITERIVTSVFFKNRVD